LLEVFLKVIGILLVLEGLFPFISPNTWRNILRKLIPKNIGQPRKISLLSNILGYKNGQIRFIGFFLMLLGIMIILTAN
tara:strand:+ start:425 stop:661 length:237 start_codon:yes stop_codon:yes gene_type:complete